MGASISENININANQSMSMDKSMNVNVSQGMSVDKSINANMSMNINHEVVVIIPTQFAKPELLKACVQALFRSEYKNYKVLLVLNGAKNVDLKKFRNFLLADERADKLEIIVLEKNLGFTGAVNKGLAHQWARQSNWIALLNDDALVDKHWLTELLKTQHKSRAQMVASVIYQPMLAYEDKIDTRVFDQEVLSNEGSDESNGSNSNDENDENNGSNSNDGNDENNGNNNRNDNNRSDEDNGNDESNGSNNNDESFSKKFRLDSQGFSFWWRGKALALTDRYKKMSYQGGNNEENADDYWLKDWDELTKESKLLGSKPDFESQQSQFSHLTRQSTILNQPDFYQEPFGPDGAACLYGRALLDELGGFRNSFFAYLEDVDLALRARLAGYSCVLADKALVIHYKHATSSTTHRIAFKQAQDFKNWWRIVWSVYPTAIWRKFWWLILLERMRNFSGWMKIFTKK